MRNLSPWPQYMHQMRTIQVFFERFHNHLRDFQCDDIIIGGDFNLVLDIEMDKKGGLAKTHAKAVKVIKDYMAELDLVDAWRLLNPDGRRYTWRRQKPEIHCRLDFFLVSQSLTCNVTNADILAGFKTDHSLVTIKLALHSNPRGPGFWKLNTSLLSEEEYVNQIKTTIKAVQKEYQEDNSVSAASTWEMIKLKVREQSMVYAKAKKTNLSKEEEKLEKAINLLQKETERNSRDEYGKQEIRGKEEKTGTNNRAQNKRRNFKIQMQMVQRGGKEYKIFFKPRKKAL